MLAVHNMRQVTGLEKPSSAEKVSILENMNLEDPSQPKDWQPVGTIVVDFRARRYRDH